MRRMKEILKTTWKKWKEQWLWISIGVYIGVALTLWLLFFYGFGVLGIAISFSFISPLIFIGIYYIRKLDSRTVGKYIWIVCGGLFLGGIMWFGIVYVFYSAPWAPLRNSPLIIFIIFSITSLVFSWALGGYIMYRLGKKRDFRPFM